MHYLFLQHPEYITETRAASYARIEQYAPFENLTRQQWQSPFMGHQARHRFRVHAERRLIPAFLTCTECACPNNIDRLR